MCRKTILLKQTLLISSLMSDDSRAKIDSISLVLLGLFIFIEIYGILTGNDVFLVIGLIATVLLYIIRIRKLRTRKKSE